MSNFQKSVLEIVKDKPSSFDEFVDLIKKITDNSGYDIDEISQGKPWGGYIKFNGNCADQFIEDFFPGLDPVDARLGNKQAELSPKLLYVLPEQRLSLQKHDRRAERWNFLSDGYYYKSSTDEPGEKILADQGDVVQFAKGETHRLCAGGDVVVVAEIWQHTDADNLSDEDDIARLQDDYNR
jgi:mannose-6-phosphate isomerase